MATKTRVKAKNLREGDILVNKRSSRVQHRIIHGTTVMAVVYDRNKPISKVFDLEDFVTIKRPKYNLPKQPKTIKFKVEKESKEKSVEVVPENSVTVPNSPEEYLGTIAV